MKKLCFLLCSLTLVLSFCSCGGKKAEEFEPADFLETLDAAIGESPEEAERLYLGKTVQVNFLVGQIKQDGEIVLYTDNRNGVPMEHARLTAKLSEEDLAAVKTDDMITIEGTISSFSEYVPSKWSDSGNRTQVELSPAKIIGRTFQVTGKIKEVLDSPYEHHPKRYSLVLEGSEILSHGEVVVYLEEEGGYKVGQTVTATGMLCGGWREGAPADQSHYDPKRVGFYMDNPESIAIVDES